MLRRTSLWFWLLSVLSWAQQGQVQPQTTPPPPLKIQTAELPKALIRGDFRAKIEAAGGTAPLRWETVDSQLPPGLKLDTSTGVISGTPSKLGEYRFTIGVVDAGKPAQTDGHEYLFKVVAPLSVDWKTAPQMDQTKGVSGIVSVSNGTDDDYDFTIIVVAVDQQNKAFALGYQRFVLKKQTEKMDIPFATNLPAGTYVIHVDAVGEVEAKNAIYRARLQTTAPLVKTTVM
jgi:putative Ig domain-containing protein